jgi:heme oxygenase
MSAIAALRSATSSAHQRLERRLDVKNRFAELGSYRAHLEGMWGFCAELEQSLSVESFEGALPDYETRRKLPLLTRDLLALGVEPHAIASLARCPIAPRPHDAAAAFGCAYVIEGATLGGRTLLPMVSRRLGLTAERGAAFLASYGQELGAMWGRFGAALDGWCDVTERQSRAACAAVTTFDALQIWLCGERL